MFASLKDPVIVLENYGESWEPTSGQLHLYNILGRSLEGKCPWNHYWMSFLTVLVQAQSKANNKQGWEAWACFLGSFVEQSRHTLSECCHTLSHFTLPCHNPGGVSSFLANGFYQKAVPEFHFHNVYTRINLLSSTFSCFSASRSCFPPNVHTTINTVSVEMNTNLG